MKAYVAGNGFIGRNLKRILGDDYDSHDTVINASGMKDILACERQPTMAYMANAIEPGDRANHAQANGIGFVHISSDHAYSHAEGFSTVYADSKRLGDQLVMAENLAASIIVTGHVYAADCPWIQWIDGELRAGRQVVAYTNRICCPTWMNDVARECLEATGGLVNVVGPDRVNRYELFTTYARVFGYDEKLIVPGLETNELLIGDSSLKSDVKTVGLEEGFKMMRDGK